MILTLDFETFPITDEEPHPEPTSVAVKVGGQPPQFHAWGQRGRKNNCTKSDAKRRLRKLIRDADRVVMFNAPFDRGVAAKHFGINIPWSKVEDMQIAAFLDEPYAKQLDLKNVAHRVLGMEPEEQTDLFDWIKKNVKEAKGKRTRLGKYIAWAPGDLVGKYAKGDVIRTWLLYRHWISTTRTRAYQREIELLPMLQSMTDTGIPLDATGLERDLPSWRKGLKLADRKLRRMLGDVDLNSNAEVADAMEAKGLINEWILTPPTKAHPDGQRSLKYDALFVLVAEGLCNGEFANAWAYRSVMDFSLTTFAEKWVKAGRWLHPQWNGTRQERGGARTGRLSSTPNVQNIVKNPPSFAVPRSWPALPALRHYVMAPRGFLLPGADISQQELRILAHAVGEPFRSWYREDPRLDLHLRSRDLIRQITGIELERKKVKVVNFSKIYGAGVPRLSKQMGESEENARMFKNAHTQAFPGIRKWENHLRGQHVFQTAGGREYCHDPERPYKSPNTYIQGSAADQAKEVMIAVQPQLITLGGSLMMMVHDEFPAIAPSKLARQARDIILDAIESTGWQGPREMFDVPMLGDGYVRRRWQE